MAIITCAIDDCTKPRESRTWCLKHYTRWRRHGDPLVTKNDYGATLARVHAAAASTTDDCVLITTQGQRRPVVSINGRSMPAARAVWTIAHSDPGESWILHTCHQGDRGCINVRHLYPGDLDQNVADMVNADRQAKGEQNGSAKLTADQVRRIRNRYRPGLGYSLAKEFGISRSQLKRIIDRRSWAHID